jgi:hypothetical protein
MVVGSSQVVTVRTGGSIFSVGIDYRSSPHPVLPEATADAARVEAFFRECGFSAVPGCQKLASAPARDIVDAVERWADIVRDNPRDGAVVLYLAGHGRLHNGRHYTLAASSPEAAPYSGTRAVSADDLVERILNSGARRGLLLLDVCRAGFAAYDVQAALDRAASTQAGPSMDLAVLVSCLHHEKSYSGLFVEGLLGALREGSASGAWRDGDEFVTPFELREELRDRLQDEQCAEVAGRDGLKMVPNPRYRADAADRTVELGELLKHLNAADREHFLRKAASTDAGDIGWFFTGRRQASQQVVDWLGDRQKGVLAVTGAPGAGKSAFLGHLAVLGDPDSQAACRALGLLDGEGPTRPPVGSFDAVIHLKNRRVDDAATDIGHQLGIDLSDSTSPARDLVTQISDNHRQVTVLADALDEAERGEEELIARDVLRAIAGLPGCRVIVGTRRDRDGRHDATPDDPGPLVAALRPRGGAFEVLDLSADQDTEADIASYVQDRLAQAEVAKRWPTPARRREAAFEVARQAGRVFLYARFALRVLEGLDEEIVEHPGWRDQLPSDVGHAGLHQVFAQDLQRFADPVLVSEVLTPLAFARGKGLPRRQIWPELATALSQSDRAYNASDISRVIRDAGWYLTEATEDGQAVFRLYHQAIGDYLLEEVTRADAT